MFLIHFQLVSVKDVFHALLTNLISYYYFRLLFCVFINYPLDGNVSDLFLANFNSKCLKQHNLIKLPVSFTVISPKISYF